MRPDQALAGQTLLVIGGGSGIGLETARIAHAQGAAVILTARDPERVRRAGIELEGRIAAFDATDFDRLGKFFDELVPNGIDHVLVTGSRPHDIPLTDLDVDVARLDLEGQLLLPLLVAQGAARTVHPGGTVIFTGCTGDRRANARPALVSAIGAALSTMTRNLASELAPIRVNVIVASPFEPPSPAVTPSTRLSARLANLGTPMLTTKPLTPAGVAALAVHLMTNIAVTGATLEISGVRSSLGGDEVG